MLTIWGRENSSNVKKVLWLVEELSLPYELIKAGGQFGMLDDPAYRALNPNGLIPTIRDGDFVLWESNAIIRYLIAQYGGDLQIEDTKEQAAADKWLDWSSTAFIPAFRDPFWNLVRATPEQRNPEAIAKGVAACTRLLGIVDEALKTQPYLSGQRFGAGDIALGCFVYPWFEIPMGDAPLPHVRAWYERLKERPAYRKAVAIPIT